MSKLDEEILSQVPIKLLHFLRGLSEAELDQLSKVEPNLVAKIYQAGALISLEIYSELKNATAEGKR